MSWGIGVLFLNSFTATLMWNQSSSRSRIIAILVLVALSILIIGLLMPKVQTEYDHQPAYSTYAALRASTGAYLLSIISDKDQASKVEGANRWQANTRAGVLTRQPTGRYEIQFAEPASLFE